jgi:glycosyltransferase involved in cell wall biosynthesis
MLDLADVSVILPCFNSENTVLRALESVTSQTFLPAELIIVDDGSVDGTVGVIEKFIDSYKGKMCIVLKRCFSNSGPSVARNIGWDVSRFSYLAFLDSDDEWCSRKIETQYKWMINHPRCVLSGHKCIYPNADSHDFEGVFFYRVSPWRILISNPFPTPSVMLRKDLPFRFDTRMKRLEDQLLWAEIALSGFRCYFSPSPMTLVHKKAYGSAGLSASLIKMEIGELMMYNILHDKKQISWFSFIFFEMFSMLKFLRRIFVVSFERCLFFRKTSH